MFPGTIIINCIIIGSAPIMKLMAAIDSKTARSNCSFLTIVFSYFIT